MKNFIAQLNEQILKVCDIDISNYDEEFILKSLEKRMKQTNYKDKDEYLLFIEENCKEGTEFFHSLFISYSEFFRNPLTFAVLENIIIPQLRSRKEKLINKEIRIWSAACAAGQETYSLAMLMNESKKNEKQDTNFRIFATDYSEKQIKIAQKGQFQSTAMCYLTVCRLKKWFTRNGYNYTIKDELKTNIDFSVFDLLNENLSCPPNSIFGDFDIVICANLLFYYKPEYRHRILDKGSHCLAKGGYVITGETEREILLQHNFEEVYPYSCIFRKIIKQTL